MRYPAAPAPRQNMVPTRPPHHLPPRGLRPLGNPRLACCLRGRQSGRRDSLARSGGNVHPSPPDPSRGGGVRSEGVGAAQDDRGSCAGPRRGGVAGPAGERSSLGRGSMRCPAAPAPLQRYVPARPPHHLPPRGLCPLGNPRGEDESGAIVRSAWPLGMKAKMGPLIEGRNSRAV
jgi:hypothetical protein